MSLKTPCEVIVLCLFGFFIRLYAFFPEESRQYPIYIHAKAKVTSEHVFHHVEYNATSLVF